MRRGVGSEGNGLASKIFNAVDPLAANDAVGTPRPIHHEEGVSVEVFVLELSVVLGPNVRRGQHHINVVGRQRRSAICPVINNLKRHLEALIGIDRARCRVQAAIGDQTGRAAHPNIHTNSNLTGPRTSRSRKRQRLGGI